MDVVDGLLQTLTGVPDLFALATAFHGDLWTFGSPVGRGNVLFARSRIEWKGRTTTEDEELQS